MVTETTEQPKRRQYECESAQESLQRHGLDQLQDSKQPAFAWCRAHIDVPIAAMVLMLVSESESTHKNFEPHELIS